MKVRFPDLPVCFLADFISEYLILSECREAISEYYNFIGNKHRVNEQNPFNQLTESRVPSLGFMGGSKQGSRDSIDGPLSEPQLGQMFDYLFPGDDAEHKYPYEEKKNEPVSLNLSTLKIIFYLK